MFVLSMIIKSGAACTSVYLYKIFILQMVQWYIFVHVCYWLVDVLYAIGNMFGNCSMCVYVDASKLQINITLSLMFHNITTSLLI